MRKYSKVIRVEFLLVIVILVCGHLPINAAEFIPLGFLGGDVNGEFRSAATAISDDGLVIAGRTTGPLWASDGLEPKEGIFRWTRELGMAPVSSLGLSSVTPDTDYYPQLSRDGSTLQWQEGRDSFVWSASNGETMLENVGDLFPTLDGLPGVLSSDGKAFVGARRSPREPSLYQVQRWTVKGGLIAIPLPDSFDRTSDGLISSDGTTIVGATDNRGIVSDTTTFRWTEDSGSTLLPHGELGENYHFGLSSDGDIVFGTFRRFLGFNLAGRGSSEVGIWRWSEALGTEIIASNLTGYDSNDQGINPENDFTDLFFSRYLPRHAVSDDGRVVVGPVSLGRVNLGDRAVFRWTESSGMVVLPHFEGYDYSQVHDLTPDGKWILGSSQQPLDATDPSSVGWLWSEGTGMVNIVDLMIQQGLGPDIEEWQRLAVGDSELAPVLSADGRAIIATGINADGNYEGWVAYLDPVAVPEPASALLLAASSLLLAIMRFRDGN